MIKVFKLALAGAGAIAALVDLAQSIGQWVVLVASFLVACGYLWKRVIRPLADTAREASELLPVLHGLGNRLHDFDKRLQRVESGVSVVLKNGGKLDSVRQTLEGVIFKVDERADSLEERAEEVAKHAEVANAEAVRAVHRAEHAVEASAEVARRMERLEKEDS